LPCFCRRPRAARRHRERVSKMAGSRDIVTDDLLQEFLAEARADLAGIQAVRERLRLHPNDPDLHRRLLELVHTAKGACGFLPLPRLEAVASAAADFLDAMRDGRVAATPGTSMLIFGLLDRMEDLLSGVGEAGEEPPGEDNALIRGMVRAIPRVMPAATAPANAAVAEPPSVIAIRGAAVVPPSRPERAAEPVPAAAEAPSEPQPEPQPELPSQSEPQPVRRAFLIFRAGGGFKAIDLADVAWLDVCEAAAIGADDDGESAEALLQGVMTRLIAVDGSPPDASDGARPVIVLAEGARRLGLVVDDIVDIFADLDDAAATLALGAEAAAAGQPPVIDLVDRIRFFAKD